METICCNDYYHEHIILHSNTATEEDSTFCLLSPDTYLLKVLVDSMFSTIHRPDFRILL